MLVADPHSPGFNTYASVADLRAFAARQILSLLTRRDVDVGDARTVVRQAQCDRLPDAAARPCNEGHPA